MAHLVEIAFKGNRKEFFLWDGEEPLHARTSVIVEVDRGEDLGRVHAVGDAARHRCAGCAHGLGAEAQPQHKVLRTASGEDERRHAELRAADDEARRKAAERVREHKLPMKISDAEWQWDRRKLTLYFTAEKRVDFRALVRDLAGQFRTRIELKQIGVRDEAKRLGGIGRCGREYCSASWLPDLRPVNLQAAKDQKLSLNPSQISGACGRLMCCLRYEHEFYAAARKRFPKEGKTVATQAGEEKVVSTDIFNDRVTLRNVEGEARTITLAEFKAEVAAAGAPAPAMSVTAEFDIEAMSIATDERGDTILEEEPVSPRAAERRSAPAERLPAPRERPEPGAPGAPAAPAGDGAARRRRRGRRGGRRGGGPGGGAAPPAPGGA
ncbi:MAG TPA: regulatory iron-sulfur-containing complex subunit RicT [Gemmatimonadaceae bacterium]|nr:regulatory iron-sulfur-containing complex subunit RicT [Gemmatimonadaceae bacterium]